MAYLKKTEIFKSSRLKPVLALLLMAMVISAGFRDSEPEAAARSMADSLMTSKAKRTLESKQAFEKAYTVFMHPRCMNCHPNGNQPLQGDDSHIHLQNVVRGPEGKGVYAMKCKNCHQDTNLAGEGTPPGNPHWQMPSSEKPMVFQGKTARELAIHFKDNKFTGFKTLNDMVKHVEEESLVLSGFDPPAGVSKIPMSHEEFVAAVKEWIDKGAAVPDK